MPPLQNGKGQFFSAIDEKVKNIHEIWTVWRVDDSRGNRILIVLHLNTQLQ